MDSIEGSEGLQILLLAEVVQLNHNNLLWHYLVAWQIKYYSMLMCKKSENICSCFSSYKQKNIL